MNRYNPFLVILHWLLAAMIFGALFMGQFVLSATPNSAPEKILSLQLHMSVGLAILALMLIRLTVRWRTQKPPHAETGNARLDIVGRAAHWGFYVLVISMCVSGIVTARLAGLQDIVFGGSGAPLPADFSVYSSRVVHSLIGNLLVGLIVLHIGGFLYHQYKLKDRLFNRMWFGND